MDDTTEIRGLSVLLADEDTEALRATGAVVRELGHEVAEYAVGVAEAGAIVERDDPDISMVVVHQDVEHALELIDELSEVASGPVIVLLERDDPEVVREAARRGIDAFAHSSVAAEVQAAIEMAVRRHEERNALTEQVAQLEGALERRLVIERAKGILMERHGVDERAAFAMLREHARDRGRRVVDVASSVAEGHALLPGRVRGIATD